MAKARTGSPAIRSTAAAILFFLGWALFSAPAALVGVLALVVFWARKARFEERLLAERYPGYDDYRRRTPRRLLPFVY